MSSSVRVCHLIHNLQRGGAEHVLVDLAKAAPAAGIDLSVVSLMPVEADGFGPALRSLGVRVHSLELATRWDPRGFARGLAAVRELGAEVVHTHLKHADLLGAYVSRRLHVPMVSTLHLIEDVSDPLGRAKRWLAAQARLRTAARTIAVSEVQRRWYLDAFPGVRPAQVVTIHNGVVPPPPLPDGALTALRTSLGVPPERLMATMAGVMRPAKGHRELIDAAERLPRDIPLTIVLAGDGVLRPALEAMAAAKGLGRNRVVFAGFRDDVPQLLAASDFVVHPSLADALPTALIYALAAGKPCLASDVGGIPEVVTPGCGVLVPPGDVPALLAALDGLARDKEARAAYGAAARRRFDAEFDACIWAHRLRALYRSVTR